MSKKKVMKLRRVTRWEDIERPHPETGELWRAQVLTTRKLAVFEKENHNKYQPHEGKRELERRRKRVEREIHKVQKAP